MANTSSSYDSFSRSPSRSRSRSRSPSPSRSPSSSSSNTSFIEELGLCEVSVLLESIAVLTRENNKLRAQLRRCQRKKKRLAKRLAITKEWLEYENERLRKGEPEDQCIYEEVLR